MKELTIEQKAQRYDEALERVNELNYVSDKDSLQHKTIEHIFPELVESDDERIRKAIRYAIGQSTHSDGTLINEVSSEEALAWLEKQGEQNTADEVVPRFKVGDWIIFNEHHNSVYQVEKVQGLRYYLRHYTGGSLSVHIDNELIRPWTIQDAKDGDVLACNEEILLFKSYSVQGRISLYCWYNGQTNNFHSKEVSDTLLTTRNKICPATKEQRDTLMKAMSDAGYTFDFKKKELKKIK